MRKHTLLTLLATVALLPACAATDMTAAEKEMTQTMGAEAFQPATRDLRDGIETQDLLAQASFWSREYQLNPGDLESAIKLAATVRKMGNPTRAIEITQTTRALYPKDPYLIAEYAAALISAEQGETALPVIEKGLNEAPGYARLWSLRGAALDQQEKYTQARKSYQKALSITPYDPNVLANLGLSFALEGDAATAETWLSRAVAIPGASDSVKRNLDLVRQLQGKPAMDAKPTRTALRGSSQTVTAPRGQAMPTPARTQARTQATTQIGAAPQPQRSFKMFTGDEAKSAAQAARLANQGRGPQVLKSTDPNALDRLARNASPVGRARAGARAQMQAKAQAQQAQAQAQQAQAQAAMQGQPRQPMAPQNAPQGYPQAYPQGMNPYAQMPAQGYPQGSPQGPQQANPQMAPQQGAPGWGQAQQQRPAPRPPARRRR